MKKHDRPCDCSTCQAPGECPNCQAVRGLCRDCDAHLAALAEIAEFAARRRPEKRQPPVLFVCTDEKGTP